MAGHCDRPRGLTVLPGRQKKTSRGSLPS